MNNHLLAETLKELETLVNCLQFEIDVLDYCAGNDLDVDSAARYAAAVCELLKNRGNVTISNLHSDKDEKSNTVVFYHNSDKIEENDGSRNVFDKCDSMYKSIVKLASNRRFGGVWKRIAAKIERRGEKPSCVSSYDRIVLGNPMLSWDEEPAEGVTHPLIASEKWFYDVKKNRTLPLPVMVSSGQVMLPWDIIKRIKEGTLIELPRRR